MVRNGGAFAVNVPPLLGFSLLTFAAAAAGAFAAPAAAFSTTTAEGIIRAVQTFSAA